jgi:hypothetical protein
MAYVLGYLYADGSMEDAQYLRGKYVRVSSIDRITIEKIRDWFESEHTIVSHIPLRGRTKYLLRIGSKIMYMSLERHGLKPCKSLRIRFPRVPFAVLPNFIRGYFDGDGCVYLERGKGRNGQIILKRLRVTFTSGSRIFLRKMRAILLQKFKIKMFFYRGNRSFQLTCSTGESIRLFLMFYSGASDETFLVRKFNVFKKYFEICPRERVDAKVQSVLHSICLKVAP